MAHHHRNHSRQPDLNATQAIPSQPMQNEAEGWPLTPEPITGPLPTPTQRGDGNRSLHEDRRQQREQERSQKPRREYLWRKQFDLRLERQRLDAEEQALKLQWDALPRPASRLLRLILALMILLIVIASVVLYPTLLIPLALVLFVAGSIRRRRYRAFRPRDTQWTEHERYRIQSRVALIDARMAQLVQEEQAISRELLALTAWQPDPEP